jgi:hypothetical protein
VSAVYPGRLCFRLKKSRASRSVYVAVGISTTRRFSINIVTSTQLSESLLSFRVRLPYALLVLRIVSAASAEEMVRLFLSNPRSSLIF